MGCSSGKQAVDKKDGSTPEPAYAPKKEAVPPPKKEEPPKPTPAPAPVKKEEPPKKEPPKEPVDEPVVKPPKKSSKDKEKDRSESRAAPPPPKEENNSCSVAAGKCQNDNAHLQHKTVDISKTTLYDKFELDKDAAGDQGLSESSIEPGAQQESALEDGYSHVITESSSSERVQTVLNDFNPNISIDLGICGQSLKKADNAQSRTLEEENIIRGLQEHGLISRPTAQATGGLCFEVVEAGDTPFQRKPPLRLAKLVVKKPQKKEGLLGEDTTDADLAEDEEAITSNTAAEESSNAQDKTDIVEIEEKLNRAFKNREEHFDKIRQKLKEHDDHIDKVKHRRMSYMALDDETDEQGNGRNFEYGTPSDYTDTDYAGRENAVFDKLGETTKDNGDMVLLNDNASCNELSIKSVGLERDTDDVEEKIDNLQCSEYISPETTNSTTYKNIQCDLGPDEEVCSVYRNISHTKLTKINEISTDNPENAFTKVETNDTCTNTTPTNYEVTVHINESNNRDHEQCIDYSQNCQFLNELMKNYDANTEVCLERSANESCGAIESGMSTKDHKLVHSQKGLNINGIDEVSPQ